MRLLLLWTLLFCFNCVVHGNFRPCHQTKYRQVVGSYSSQVSYTYRYCKSIWGIRYCRSRYVATAYRSRVSYQYVSRSYTGCCIGYGGNSCNIRQVWNVRVFPSVQGTFPNLKVAWDAIGKGKVNYHVCYGTNTSLSDEPPSNATCTTVRKDYNDTCTTLDRLDKATTYHIWIAGMQYSEKGPYSTRADGTTYQDPLPPQTIQLHPVDIHGALMVSWSEIQHTPLSAPVISYAIQYRREGETNYTTDFTGSQSNRWVVRNLHIGTTYEVRVASVSGMGNGTYCCGNGSQATTYDIPKQIKNVEMSQNVQHGEPSLLVSWAAPYSDTPIRKYHIQYKIFENDTQEWTIMSTDHPVNFTVLGHLNKSTWYIVQVRAVSVIGLGQFSEKQFMQTYDVPHSIDKMEAVQMSCQGQPGLRLSWTAPQSDLPIQYYAVTHAVSDVITGNITTITPNVTICNLPMGILHEVSTVAVSALGSGREGTWTTVRSPTVPSKVPYTNVLATTSNGTAAFYIEWEHPLTDLPIIHYKLSVATSDPITGYTPQSIAKTVYVNNTNITIGELVLNTTYTVAVTAESAIGLGQNNTLEVTTLAVPSPKRVTGHPLPQPGTVRITWTPLDEDSRHGLDVIGYCIIYSEEEKSSYRKQIFPPSTALFDTVSVDLVGLEHGLTYYVGVATVTTAGIGIFSQQINVTTYPDCCSQCPTLQSALVVTFQTDTITVSESQSLLLIEIYRYGPMMTPVTLKVTDLPGNASEFSDYKLVTSEIYFISTQKMVEKVYSYVQIYDDYLRNEVRDRKFFKLLLHATNEANFVFGITEMTVVIVDDDCSQC